MSRPTTNRPVETLKAAHTAFNDGDMQTVLDRFDEDIEWTTLVGTAHGRTTVEGEVFPAFAELLAKHDASSHTAVNTYISEGDDVVAIGRGVLSRDDETVEVPFAQHCRVIDGTITYGRTYSNTATFFEFFGVDA